MGVVSVISGQQTTVIGSENALSTQAGVGVYILCVDVSTLAAGDTLQVIIKTKCRPADNTNIAFLKTIADLQIEQNWYSVPVPIDLGGSISCSLKQTTGVVRQIPWNLLRA